MKGALLDEKMQLEKNNEVISIARPQVKATGQFQYLFVTPKQRIDAGAFDFSSSLGFISCLTTTLSCLSCFSSRSSEDTCIICKILDK